MNVKPIFLQLKTKTKTKYKLFLPQAGLTKKKNQMHHKPMYVVSAMDCISYLSSKGVLLIEISHNIFVTPGESFVSATNVLKSPSEQSNLTPFHYFGHTHSLFLLN